VKRKPHFFGFLEREYLRRLLTAKVRISEEKTKYFTIFQEKVENNPTL
jgi:hypothetical protein